MITTTRRIARLVGQCPTCKAGAALEDHGTAGRITTACTGCGTRLVLARIEGVYSDKVPCDGRCMGAVGPHCACPCGGENHGVGYIAPTSTRPVWAKEADAKRKAAADARAAAKRDAARRERETGRDALLAAHPDLVWLTYLDNLSKYVASTSFLDSMADALHAGRMSDRQAATGADAIAWHMTRADSKLARAAAEAARRTAGVTAPTGRVTVTGEVVTVKARATFYGYQERTEWKMLVTHADGWKVWTTVPADLIQAAMEAQWAHQDANPYVRPRGWDTFLVGRQVRFTATLALAKNDPDPLFVIGSRPTGAALV